MTPSEVLNHSVAWSPRWLTFGSRGSWQSGIINIRQRVGEMTIGHVAFQGAIFTSDFLSAPVLGAELDELPLRGFPPGWDAIKIPSAPIESAPSILRFERKMIRYVPHIYQRHLIGLDRFATYDEYLARFSSKRRHELRRTCRGFPDIDGQPAFAVFRSGEEMAAFHRLASEVSGKTYQSQLIGAGLDGSTAMREALCNGADEGRVRGYLLYDGPTPVAFGLCERDGSRLVYDKTGYDPQFAGRSPGTVLLCKMVESLIGEREFSLLDLAEGTSAFKEKFATDSRRCADILYFRPTLRATLAVLTNRVLSLSSWSVVRALDYLNLKQRVKKIIRRAGNDDARARPDAA